MIIENLALKKDGGYVVLSADCKIRHWKTDRMYFKLDGKFENEIVVDYSPFLASLLIPAMKLGEDIEIRGSVSGKIMESVGLIQDKLFSWNIGLKKINVKSEGLNTQKYSSSKIATFFSGGVDSFYTYLKNKNDGVKTDYFILANGFDINLRNKILWGTTSAHINEIAEKEKVGLIEIESNVRDIIEPIVKWDYSHGGCLASLGILLGKDLKHVYMASTYTFDQMFPWGSHPELDKYWSTESTEFHHHGAEVTRLQKVIYISKYPVVLETLRVCYLNVRGQFNCGKCDKCLRTMINLEIAGKLNDSKTFSHSIDLDILNKIKIESEHGAIFHRENLDYLIDNHKREDIQLVLKSLLSSVGKGDDFKVELLRKIMFYDFYYLGGFFYGLLNIYRYRL